MKGENLKKHLLYWILPSVVTLSCILLFYLDWFGLSELMAPEMNREFGVVENLQLAILVLILIYSIKGIRKRETKIEKYGYVFVAAATSFVFLEEIDYGLHYYDFLIGKTNEGITKVAVFDRKIRNIHNEGKITLNLFKLASYALIVACFVVLPLLPATLKKRFSLLNYFAPSRFIITTAISLLILNQIALYLYKNYDYSNPSLNNNVSEFEELMTYYIIFLYIREMIRKPRVNNKLVKV
jgi:hypothetical protein